MSFGGGGNHKDTADDDFVNRMGPNRTLPIFGGTRDVEMVLPLNTDMLLVFFICC